jgi:phage tail-like protein
MSESGLGLRFSVKIDGKEFGNWQRCDGLAVEYDVIEYKEGGENAYVHRLPGRANYPNIKLTRPVDASSSSVSAWVASLQVRMVPSVVQIAVHDPAGEQVAMWVLSGAYPVRWTGPQLDVNGNQWATETLEIAHNGFLVGM